MAIDSGRSGVAPPGVALARRRLAERLIRDHPEEAALQLETAPETEAAAVLDALPVRIGLDLFLRLSPDIAASALGGLRPTRASELLGAIEPSRAASLLARTERPVRERCLSALPDGLANELRQLAAYPLDTAGGLMDSRVTAFRPEMPVVDALRRVRALKRRVQDVFLTDEEGRLAGSVPLVEMVFAARGARLGSIAQREAVAVQATASREEVLERLEATHASSLAVTDFDGRLLGVLRQAELLRTVEQEATADLTRMVGVSRDERALSSPWFAVRKRLPWLQINLLTAFLAASVVGLFEGTISRFTALAVLLPVVAGQSGNTGAQALAVTMRGLALREIRLRHWWRVSSKELTAGAVNGLLVAATTAAGVWLWSRSPGLALVIGVSMVLSMTVAGLAGAAIPMLLTAARQDPAQSSSVVLTTVTDVSGFFSFLGIATLLSRLL
jgi:magnesium transporter